MAKGKLLKNIFFFIALFALIGIVWSTGFDIIIENIKHTGWWFVPIIGIWLVVYIINARAFQLIICDENNADAISFPKSLQVTITAFALNYSTPAGMMGGMPYRIMELKTLVGTNKATSSVVLYTMLHIMAHFIFWLSSILLLGLFITMKRDLAIVFTAVFIVFVGLIILFFRGYKRGVLLKFFSILKNQPLFKKRLTSFYEKKEGELIEIDTQISDLYLNRRAVFYKVLALEYLGRLVNCLEVYFVVHAIGIDITYVHAFVMVAMTTLLANLLFFIPMQVGPREGGYAVAIDLLKIAPVGITVAALGVYVSLITRVRELLWIGFGMILMKLSSKQ
jgi:hypothetical protein